MSAIIENNLQVNLSQCLPISEQGNNNRLQSFKTTLNIWLARSRQRKQLAKLSDHLLEDIGYTRAQVQKEISKPFWK